MRRERLSSTVIGAIAAAVIACGVYLAFAKELPFASDGYTVNAVFDNALTLRETAPVRVAGVNVGEVIEVERDGNLARATFSVDGSAQPIRSDSTVKLRPRLFLEGNYFLDLNPGSPAAPELASGATIPAPQTSTAVQLDEVLSALTEPTREDLRDALQGWGTALSSKPTAADDADSDADVRGETAAEAISDSFAYGGRAGRSTAVASEAFRGERAGDLAKLVGAQRDVFGELERSEQSLVELITRFDVVATALASERDALERTIGELAPTLERAEPALVELNLMIPVLRAWAVDIRPGIRELPATIAAGLPWLRQARPLLAADELGGTARLLRRIAPDLDRATGATTATLTRLELLSRCVTDVLVPTGNQVIQSPFATGEPSYRDLLYASVAMAGESQGFDGNGPYLRFQSGGGPVRVESANPGGGFQNDRLYANTIAAPEGTQPALAASRPPLRADIACHRNDPPNLNGTAAVPGPPSPAVSP